MKFIEKYFKLFVLFLGLLLLMQQCRTNNKIKSLNKTILTQSEKIDSLNIAIVKNIKIEGLKTSKRTLYDWNTVIRTTTRPDDLMIRYDLEIEKLQNSK